MDYTKSDEGGKMCKPIYKSGRNVTVDKGFSSLESNEQNAQSIALRNLK